MQFEKKAQEYILDNIRASYSGKRGLISRVESFARLMVWAGVREDFNEPAEEVLTKAFSRIVVIDSRWWIEFLLDVLPAVQLRMMLMFYITVWQKYMADFDNEEAMQNLMDLADSSVLLVKMLYMWIIVLEWQMSCVFCLNESVYAIIRRLLASIFALVRLK